MKTTYILDTSVLIDDPLSYKYFKNSNVIIPIKVINELDIKKSSIGEFGRNSRVCIRLLEKLSEQGNISSGILIEDDITISIDSKYRNMRSNFYKNLGDSDSGDTHILACALDNFNEHKSIVLVSNDLNLRLRAKALGIQAIGYENTKFSLSKLYSGAKIIINEEAGLDLQKKGIINPKDYDITLEPHECVLFENTIGDGIALGRKIAIDKIKVIKKSNPWNISSRNKEQAFAIDLIMDKNIDLVTLIGRSGTGKSLIALASALELVLNKREYEKLIIYRPIQSVGAGIGHLPGEIAEKLAPWFQAIMDSFEILFGNKNKNDWKKDLEMYQRKGRIEMEAITYIRGRSIPNCIILVDESQNISKDEIKTILTRVGENTKIILTGDIEQIDNSSLDATSNGLTYVIEKFKTSDIAGHITFTQGERSRLATLSSEIL